MYWPAFRKRTVTLEPDASGDAEETLHLGAKYGMVVSVSVDYGADAAATADLTVVDANSVAVYSNTDSSTDVPLTAQTSGKVFQSPFTVTVAQAGDGTAPGEDHTVEVNLYVHI